MHTQQGGKMRDLVVIGFSIASDWVRASFLDQTQTAVEQNQSNRGLFLKLSGKRALLLRDRILRVFKYLERDSTCV